MQFYLRVLVASLFLTSGLAESTSKSFLRSSPIKCTSDEDCAAGEQFCAGGVCQDFGTCRDLADCLNPSNEYSSIMCLGYTDCVDNQCTTVCGDDVCPNGQPSVRCMASPCSASTCISPIASCVDYYCGGCNALFFDPKGDLSCGSVNNDEWVEPALPMDSPNDIVTATLCESDTDCGDEQYCGQGECLDFGACASDLDCFNPSNIYSTIFCVGPLQCQEGTCGRICGAECPDNGGEPVPCGEEVTCETASCDDVPDARCVQNDCDGCSPMFLDAAGRRVCDSKNGGSTVTSSQRTCLSDDDCDDQYCAGGVCQDFGYCRALEDCLNPSNVYNTILCVGFVECVDNQCGIQCSSDVCPDDQPLAECQAPPCTYSLCNGPIGSCVDYYCGGCHALFFNPMGDLGCGPAKNDDVACSSDADCGDSEYCAGGSCLELGSCGETVDCRNPSNIFPILECLGHVNCNAENICETICGPECPDDADFVSCLQAPCEASSCDEDYVSCIDDYCGGCNAIFLDAQGKQVCTGTEEVDTKSSTACLMKSEDCTGNWFSRSMCSIKNAIAKVSCAF